MRPVKSAQAPRRRRFVVLDRDGTIMEERGYLSNPDGVKLLPAAAAALRDLSQMGFGLVVLTNQSGIGRGLFGEGELQKVHERLVELLAAEGVRLDGLYFCPHKPEDGCSCRKPRLGLVERAAADLNFGLKESIVIGDKASDIEMGRRMGALTLLVRTGYGAQTAAEESCAADYVVEDLIAALPLVRRSAREARGAAQSRGALP